MKPIVITALLLILFQCTPKKTFFNSYSKMMADSIMSIAYYDGNRYFAGDTKKTPQCIINDFATIQTILSEINAADNPSPWKGAKWNFILLTNANHTVDTLYLNEKVIAAPHASGWFYKFKKDKFIERYFSKDPTETHGNGVSDSINRLKKNLIGKNPLELRDYASHTCWSIKLQDSITGFSITKFAQTIDECRVGKSIIILEKALQREHMKTAVKVKDELVLYSHMPDTCYAMVRLALKKDGVNNYYIASYQDNREELISTIHKLWLIDLANEKLTPVSVPDKIRCFNPDYLE